jgi:16S rRNA (cytosine967-C5)-methyltransferase
MRAASRIQATIEALAAVYTTPKPADGVLSNYFRARRYIGSHDRADVAANVYACLRHHTRIGWWLQRVGLPEDARTTALCWALLEGLPFETLLEYCNGGQYAPEAMRGGEREAVQKLAGRSIEHPDMPEAVKLECPDWAAEQLKAHFGESFPAEMRALQQAAPVDIRVNPLKATREDVQKRLAADKIKTTPLERTPLGLRVEGRPNLAATATFKDGLIEIQDEGSQLLAELVQARPGEQVVDFCAGAGGKTLAVAGQMKNKGRIIACDVLEPRLKRAQERFRRAGVHNIETRLLANERDPWVKRHKESFDRVLIDAPCTGVGVWRRNPDARWRPLGPGLDKLVPLQQEILQSAARLVKVGGRLVYATCSLLPQENAQQIETFLASEIGAKFVVEPCGLEDAQFLTLTPAQHNTDGFFGAVLVRKMA